MLYHFVRCLGNFSYFLCRLNLKVTSTAVLTSLILIVIYPDISLRRCFFACNAISNSSTIWTPWTGVVDQSILIIQIYIA